MSLTYIPVVGTFTYRDEDGTPAAGGKIHFIPVTPAVVDGETITLPKKLICTLNADGEVPAGFEIPTVGDGVYYKIIEKFAGAREPYTIEVLVDDVEIDLATVAPVVPVDPLVSYATNQDLDALELRVDDLEGSQIALSDATPAALGPATAGSGAAASRADHVHEVPTADEIQSTYGGTVDDALFNFNVALEAVQDYTSPLAGGTAGQVPIKQSSDELDYTWGNLAAADVGAQPADSDLTAIAELATTSYGRALLTLADQAALKAAVDYRTPAIQSVTSSATVTPTFSNDMVKITAQAAALLLANPTGTAIPGLGMVIRMKDNGTARAITYDTQYRAIGITLPTTTVLGKTTYIAMIYNSDDTKWDCVATGTQA